MEERPLYIVDGGLATEIERRGVSLLNDPLWSARLLHTQPKLILDVHKSFLQNGADIIITASYQASIDGFHKHLGLSSEQALELMAKSVSLAKEARDWFLQQPEHEGRMCPLIAGSVGPYGACLSDGSEYTGNYLNDTPIEVIKEWHKPRMKQLIESGIDLLAIETIPSLKEAAILLELLAEYPQAKAWVSFTCKDERHTCYGEVFSDAVKVISSCKQVMAVGINCSPPQYIEGLLDSVSECSLPLIVYPNSGEGWCSTGWCGEKIPFIEQSQRWVSKGVKIIGKGGHGFKCWDHFEGRWMLSYNSGGYKFNQTIVS